jgi:hypothetical protein
VLALVRRQSRSIHPKSECILRGQREVRQLASQLENDPPLGTRG